MCTVSCVCFSDYWMWFERFLALYFSLIDGKQPTYVSKSRDDMKRECKSLCIASLSRESKWTKWIRRTFSLEAKVWFPFYLVIAQFLNLSVNQGGALSLNVMKRNFEIPLQEWCFCFARDHEDQRCRWRSNYFTNHRRSLKIRFRKTNEMTRFI